MSLICGSAGISSPGYPTQFHINLLHADSIRATNFYRGQTNYWFNERNEYRARSRPRETVSYFELARPDEQITEAMQNVELEWETLFRVRFHEAEASKKTIDALDQAVSSQCTILRLRRGYKAKSCDQRTVKISRRNSTDSSLDEVKDKASLCLYITGAASGRSWTCSTMGTALFDHIKPKDRNLEHLNELRYIMQSFAYDPVASRCLVTLTLVGVIMEGVTDSYNRAGEHLQESLHLSDSGSVFDMPDSDYHPRTVGMDPVALSRIRALSKASERLQRFAENISNIEESCEAAVKDLNVKIQGVGLTRFEYQYFKANGK